MRKGIVINLILIAFAALALRASAFGQDTAKPAETPQPSPTPAKPVDMRTAVLGQLSLSRDQLQQIRRVNQERKPLMDAAQARLRDANKVLDEAIYSDQMDEPGFQAKLKEAQAAQAEVVRIRFINEFAVRRILTPEQLVRFRVLRQKFEEDRQSAEKARLPKNEVRQVNNASPAGARPLRDLKQQLKQTSKPNPQRPKR